MKQINMGKEILSLRYLDSFIWTFDCDEKVYSKLLRAFGNSEGSLHGLTAKIIRYFEDNPSSLSIDESLGVIAFKYNSYVFKGSIEPQKNGKYTVGLEEN